MVEYWQIIGAMGAAIVILIFYIKSQNEKIAALQFAKSSQSVKYGKVSEQWAPFMKDYPYDPNNSRFLGSPIDFVQFEEDKVVFVEVKTNTAKLNPREENLKKLIQDKKVEWREFRIKGGE